MTIFQCSSTGSKTCRQAVTLLELLVVVLIISILSTIATGVYTNQTRRAKIAAAQDLIHQLSLAIARYEVDTGSLPPSGSGVSPIPPAAANRYDGSGYLHMALMYSMSGSANKPASALWQGPYINVQVGQVAIPSTIPLANTSTSPSNSFSSGSANTATGIGMYSFLDPWQMPIIYVMSQDYASVGTNFSGGTRLFTGTAPTQSETSYTVNPNLPWPNLFVAQGETYYNTNTYELISFGPNSVTYPGYNGADIDDITNFGY